MPRYIRKIFSGDVYECEEFFSTRTIGKYYLRGSNQNVSPLEQRQINERQARKKLSRLINTNFKQGDLFITLTHKNRVNYEDARKELSKYLRKVRAWRVKNNLSELKYIAVTESKQKREHHHLIMSFMDLNIALSLWEQGRAHISKLEKGGEYNGLANYITKEPPEQHKKRWSQSRNLKRPRVINKKVKDNRRKSLQVPKGYIVSESYSFYSDLTGYIQYLRAIRIDGDDWAEGNNFDEKLIE